MTTPRRERTFLHLRKIDHPHLNLRSNAVERMRSVQQPPLPSKTTNNTTGMNTEIRMATMRTSSMMTNKMGMATSMANRMVSMDRKMASKTMVKNMEMKISSKTSTEDDPSPL